MTRTQELPRPSEVTSTIGAQDRIRGELHVGGCVRIDGVVRGDIEHIGPRAGVILGPGGHVRGNVRLHSIWIEGQLIGTIEADGHVDIAPGAVVHADIAYGTLRIGAGAEVSGRLRCPEAELRADES